MFKVIVNFKKSFYWHKNESVVNKLAPNIPNMRVKAYLPLFAVFPPSAHFPGCWGSSLTTVTNPATWWNSTKAHTKSMITSVTHITEHHFFFMVGLSTYNACLTFHTLPWVGLNHRNKLHGHIQARRVATVITLGAVYKWFSLSFLVGLLTLQTNST